MKRALIFALLCTTTSCLGGSNAINLHGGYHKLTENYGDLKEMPVAGLEAVVGISDAWGVEAAGFYAEEEKSSVKLKSQELGVGVRRTFLPSSPIQLYLGAGPNYMKGDLTGYSSQDGLGAYAHGGVQLSVLMLNLGIDLRYAYSGAKFDSERLSYGQATVFIGLGF